MSGAKVSPLIRECGKRQEGRTGRLGGHSGQAFTSSGGRVKKALAVRAQLGKQVSHPVIAPLDLADMDELANGFEVFSEELGSWIGAIEDERRQ